MASSSDVRAIISALPPGSVAGPSAPRKSTSKAKPEGISRELYSLIGDSAPSLVAQYARPKFKPKLGSLGRSRGAHWEWREFNNPGRTDGLRLKHWTKAGETDEAKEADYPFAKYNVPTPVMSYTQEEYEQYLQDDSWSREETDYLFTIAREYDLRFLVMADRYDFPGGPARPIEDLKDRYYSICRRLIRNRPWSSDESAKTQTLASYTFDAEQERNRKAYLNGLFDRTPAQIAEEEALYVEIKRLEQNEKRYAKDREEVLRTVAGIESGLSGLKVDWDVSAGVTMDKKKKKRMEEMMLESGAGGRTRLNFRQTPADLQHCIIRFDPPQSSSSTKTTSHTPTHLRSSKIPFPKSHIATRVTSILAETGTSISRLVMPTRTNIEKLEGLQAAAANLVEIKKNVDRVEQEIRVLLAQRDGARKVEEDDGVDMGDDDGMDMMESVEGSVPPAGALYASRQQKGVRKRSMSISSNGTAATARGNKRRRD